jgi:hypothetical protein
MNRNSTATLVVGSIITGLIAVGLTAVTRTGAVGAYAFLYGGVFVFCVYLLWPDLRARFFGGRPGGRHSFRSRPS